MRKILAKLRHLAGRRRFDDALDEEMRLHLEARVEELVGQGVSAAGAADRARREFGPSALLAEQSREAWRWSGIEDLGRDLRHAARGLARDRGFTATAVVSLALGIGLNTTIFSLTSEFLFSRPSVRDAETLVRAEIGGTGSIPMREHRFLAEAGVFQGLAGSNEMQEINWRSGDFSRRLFVTRVTGNYFGVTGTPLAFGRPIAPGDRGVAVISHTFWQSRLDADPDVLGRTLVLDGRPYVVAGVLPAVHRTLTGFGYSPDLYLPVENEAMRVSLYGRLPEGVSREAALDRLRAAAARMDRELPDSARRWAAGVTVTGLVGIERLTWGFMRRVSAFFALLMGAVGLLLAIACANVASLLLARSFTRMHEFAIRMSIGAGRGRIVRQLLAESLLLSMLGTAAGLGLNYALTRALNGATLPMPFPMRLSIQPDTRLLMYASILAVVSGVLAGLLPAFRATRGGTQALLKRDERQVSGHRGALRNVLVAGQLAVAVVVVTLAGLAVRNLAAAATLDPGFDLRRTVWAQMRLVPEGYPNAGRIRAAAASILNRLRVLPGVESAATAAVIPLNDHFLSRVSTISTDVVRNKAVEHAWNAVGPDYFRTMSIRLIAGREFTMLDQAGAQPVIIVNETFSRLAFGGSNPIGRTVRFGRYDSSGPVVVGVARNAKYSAIGERDRAAIYEPFFQVAGRSPGLHFLVRAAGPPEPILKSLNAALLAADPAASVEVIPMSLSTGFAMLPSRMGAMLLASIGALGLVLAAVGLYGVLAYSIGRRTREIGLRMALGARSGHVLRLVLGEGAWIFAIGAVAGVVLAALVTRPLAMFLVPGLRPTDPLTYAAVAVVLLVAGLAASLAPALRALRVDPMAALRSE
jgi:predicted permease